MALGDYLSTMDATPMAVLLVILAIYFILGCVLDAVGMIALTIPIFYPIIELLNIDAIWFGILLVKVVEIVLITPHRYERLCSERHGWKCRLHRATVRRHCAFPDCRCGDPGPADLFPRPVSLDSQPHAIMWVVRLRRQDGR